MKPHSYPASYAQERMWRMDTFFQQHYSTTALNIPCVLRVKGNLDLDLLNKSLNNLVMKHSSLRTIFFEHNNMLYQRLLDEVNFRISIYDLSDINHEKQKAKADEIICQETEYEFSPSKELLFRTSLIVLDPQNFIIIFLFHHLICDEWSLRVLFKDLEKTYEKYLNKEDINYSIDRTYLEFSEKQRHWFEEDKFKKQYEYWSQKLKELPHEIDFPINKPVPKEICPAAYYTYKIDGSLFHQLGEFSRSQNTTVFMIFLTAYMVTIHKFSHSNDIFVAAPIGNRHYKNIQNTVGCFVNSVLLRTFIDETLTYKQLLDYVRETALEAYDHQDVPFNLLMDTLDASEGFQKYFPQFVFELKKLNHYLLELPQLIITENYKHTLKLQSYIVLEIEYTKDIYEETIIERFMNILVRIVKTMIKNPEILINKGPSIDLEENKHTTDHQNAVIHFNEKLIITENKKLSDDTETIAKLNKCIKLSVKELI